ncbi:hypothetical protein SNOG_16273 [Parastagonospora nodorum SN15]|uniref:Uncharacterized protein n=1 Tax=Phaeosphaeria nodorum (strain SN15 / ATCC MYA-4574 / FGSC 10173) TaxID=321614 RepID=Q0TVV3_PHANO|nr:hypothetical protein SNOG_16273 [Parastagonospora nodorum SN15]EAT76259.1 hypothetical protein SNOG_16273 [Parastagonospora nodorum SN15]
MSWPAPALECPGVKGSWTPVGDTQERIALGYAKRVAILSAERNYSGNITGHTRYFVSLGCSILLPILCPPLDVPCAATAPRPYSTTHYCGAYAVRAGPGAR